VASRRVNLDEEVIAELAKLSDGRNLTPNQVLREVYNLPAKKHRRSQLCNDHLSQAEGHIAKALNELRQAKNS